MSNKIKQEKDFFSKIQKDLSNDYIRIDKSFVPKLVSNKLNRFYDDNTLCWFARLKINDDNTIYYFGDNIEDKENVIPKLILKFNSESNKSTIKFNKNKLFVLIKDSDNDFMINLNKKLKEISDELSIASTSKLKKNGIYYLIFDEINNFLINVEKLIKVIDFDVNLDKNYLLINHEEILNDEYNENTVSDNNLKSDDSIINNYAAVNDSDDFYGTNKGPMEENFDEEYRSKLFIFKQNLKIIKFIKNLNELSFKQEFKIAIIDYLFKTDENGDYFLNNSFYKYNIPFDEVMKLFYKVLDECDDLDQSRLFISFSLFKQKVIEKLTRYYSKINIPTDNIKYNEIFKEDISNYIFKEAELSNSEVIVKNNPDVNSPAEIRIETSDISLNEDQQEIFDKFLKLKETPKFKFYLIPSYGISDGDLTDILNDIKKDLSNNQFNENDSIEDAFEYYIKNFVASSNSNSVKRYLENYLGSTEFNELLNEFDSLSDHDIEDIKNKVKMDIEFNNLYESDIPVRFRKYFIYKLKEIDYLNSLELKYENISEYEKRGLTVPEIYDIFVAIQEKIENWYNDWSIFDEDIDIQIFKLIDIKENQIRRESRQKFEELFPNKIIVKKVLNIKIFKEDDYLDLKRYVYKSIYDLKIRSKDITENLLIDYYNLYVG